MPVSGQRVVMLRPHASDVLRQLAKLPAQRLCVGPKFRQRALKAEE
jgi:hypothetical protein